MKVFRDIWNATLVRAVRGQRSLLVRCCLGLLGLGVAGAGSGCRGGVPLSAPGPLLGISHSSAVPASAMTPPVEPLPQGANLSTTVPVDRPEFPVPPIVESQPAITPEQVAALQQSLEALRQQQVEVLKSLSQLQSADGQRDTRLATMESHIAAQSTALVELRKTISDQQREQWRTLDVLSDGLDEILRDEPSATVNGVAGSRRRENPDRRAARDQIRQ